MNFDLNTMKNYTKLAQGNDIPKQFKKVTEVI